MEGSTFRTTVWTKAIATAGIRHVVFHGLRVTSTTWLLDAGVNAKTVSVMQGHSSAAVTMNVYARSSAAARKSAAGKVGALLGEALAAAPNVVLIDSRRRDRQNVTRGRAGAGTETALSS